MNWPRYLQWLYVKHLKNRQKKTWEETEAYNDSIYTLLTIASSFSIVVSILNRFWMVFFCCFFFFVVILYHCITATPWPGIITAIAYRLTWKPMKKEREKNPSDSFNQSCFSQVLKYLPFDFVFQLLNISHNWTSSSHLFIFLSISFHLCLPNFWHSVAACNCNLFLISGDLSSNFDI